MNTKHWLGFFMMLIAAASCDENNTKAQSRQSGTQNAKVGGPCEGCEAIYESILPFDRLNYTDTLADFSEAGPKLMITGTIYKADGKTPAPNTILYIYHTDQKGRYPKKGNETGWGKRHGYIRGWIKTDEKGRYVIYTIKPAAYPGGNTPAHIHAIIKEPDYNEYYIDDFQFDDDPLLTATERKRLKNQGGDGIISLEKKENILLGKRDIVLGQNIPDYPKQKTAGLQSGLAIGENCPAFEPKHVSGQDAGKNACPMCKYGYGQGVMVWWNKEEIAELTWLLRDLEKSIETVGYQQLRVFVIYMNPANYPEGAIEEKLRLFSKQKEFNKVAITLIPSPADAETAGQYKINPLVTNTIFIYKKRKVIDKFIDYQYTGSMKTILHKLDLL